MAIDLVFRGNATKNNTTDEWTEFEIFPSGATKIIKEWIMYSSISVRVSIRDIKLSTTSMHFCFEL